MADQRKVSTAIVAESEERSFVFKVHGYSRAKELFKNGECVAAPPFSVGGDNWVLKYYPNGRSALSAAYIFLLLHSVDGKDVNAEARSIRVLGKDGLPVPVAQDMGNTSVPTLTADLEFLLGWVSRPKNSYFGYHIDRANKDAASYRYKVIKYWDMVSTLYNRDRATGEGARTANESAAEMAEEIANTTATNKDDNSSTKDDEDRPKKRYRSDDSIATMLGDKLDNFTAVFKADAPEPPPKPASPEEIWALLGGIPDLEDDQLLAIYDVLDADDRKFKSMLALPERMKKKWVLKQIST
ncbi:hypothetical protein ACQ4PT_050439 [Festuca glaucescens]